jgi:hypothetical protein
LHPRFGHGITRCIQHLSFFLFRLLASFTQYFIAFLIQLFGFVLVVLKFFTGLLFALFGLIETIGDALFTLVHGAHHRMV